jgi:hypothetical protein
MPNTVTIYWDGAGEIPPVVDTLPSPMREEILSILYQRVDELNQPNPIYIFSGLMVIMLFFVTIGLYSKKKTSVSVQKNTTHP